MGLDKYIPKFLKTPGRTETSTAASIPTQTDDQEFMNQLTAKMKSAGASQEPPMSASVRNEKALAASVTKKPLTAQNSTNESPKLKANQKPIAGMDGPIPIRPETEKLIRSLKLSTNGRIPEATVLQEMALLRREIDPDI